MGGSFLALPDQEESYLDEDSREILEGLRRLCSEAEGRADLEQALASAEERHLRLHLSRGAEDWLDLLVGDGYTEFTRSGEKTYKGYLTAQETITRVGRWLLH